MSSLPPGCAEACPACAHRLLSPAETRARKESFLAQSLAPWSAALEPLCEPDRRWGYRRKALLHVRVVDGAWSLGMIRRRGREEEFIPIPDCPAHEPSVNKLFAVARARVPRHWPWVFALVSGRALTLVLKARREEAWVAELRGWAQSFPAGHALYVNWNPNAGHRTLDSKRNERVLGPEWLEEGGFAHGPSAFRQQIPELEFAAVEAGRAFLRDAGVNVAVDFYCGLGASLRRWLDLGWDVAGVELSGESLWAAARNAPGALLLRGRTEERLPQVDEFVNGRPFVLYTNPPREGQGPAVNDWVVKAGPTRIAYLSCNPRSLARDLETLSTAYGVMRLLPLDFFPQTPHVETLALLSRRAGL